MPITPLLITMLSLSSLAPNPAPVEETALAKEAPAGGAVLATLPPTPFDRYLGAREQVVVDRDTGEVVPWDAFYRGVDRPDLADAHQWRQAAVNAAKVGLTVGVAGLLAADTWVLATLAVFYLGGLTPTDPTSTAVRWANVAGMGTLLVLSIGTVFTSMVVLRYLSPQPVEAGEVQRLLPSWSSATEE